MGSFTGWPLVVLTESTAQEAFDRARLLIDLDEATAPEAPLAVLLMVGMARDAEGGTDESARHVVEGLEARISTIVGGQGSIYRTRGTEVCALVEGSISDLREILGGIHDVLARKPYAPLPFSAGVVALPEEAEDAMSALILGDHRMARRASLDFPSAAA